MYKNPLSGGRRDRWPLGLDTHDPEGVAEFTLGLGYSTDSVIETLQTRCKLDHITARRIVESVANQQHGGQP